MKKKLILLLLIVFPFSIKAVTLEEYNEAVAEVGKSAGTTYTSEFVYSYFWGLRNGEAVSLKSSTTDVWLNNAKNGIKSSGYKYAAMKTEAGIIGSFQDKFAVFCESFVQLIVHHASNGAVKYYSDYEKIKVSELKKGDLIHFPSHIAIYYDDNNDTDPNTFHVAEASGTIRFVVTDREPDYGYRLKTSSLSKLDINVVKASYDFHDRLDDEKPIIRSVTKEGSKIRIQASDYKSYSLAGKSDFLEPENFGIVYYALSKTNNATNLSWINVAKTDSLNVLTDALTSTGTWYVFVKDVGGNVASSSINISSIDDTKPTIGSLSYDVTESSIKVTINGASDSSGIKGYNYYLDDELIKKLGTNTYTFTNLDIGSTYSFKYEVVDNNDNVTSSNNTSIIVKKNVSSVTLEKPMVYLKKGGTYQIKPIIKADKNNYVIKYQESNNNVATVSKTGLVTGVNYGSTIINIFVDDMRVNLNIIVIDYNLQIMTDKLDNGKVKEVYYAKIDSTVPSSSFELVSGSLPPGIKMSSEGVVSGTPTKSGEYTFTVKNVMNQEEVTKNFTISIKGSSTLIIVIILIILLGIIGYLGFGLVKKKLENL